MQVADFTFDLPASLIAQHPPLHRGDSRLLCLDGQSGELQDRRFNDLPTLLRTGDLLVFNDTRVMKARLLGSKSSGGKVEVLIERILDGGRARAYVRARKSPQAGSRLELRAHADKPQHNPVAVEVLGRSDNLFEIQFLDERAIPAILDDIGEVPLPPYITRRAACADEERYQTVYAREPGAIAAPTAGLHFSEPLLSSLNAQGFESAFITLHVGAGTFAPLRVDKLEQHTMHREFASVTPAVCAQINQTRARGGRIIAVGTTSARALETASRNGTLLPFQGETDIFIYPGHRFLSMDALITNFHLPESTLLMLVCAFAGQSAVLAAYRHAVAQQYRFFSYGDAMFITRKDFP